MRIHTKVGFAVGAVSALSGCSDSTGVGPRAGASSKDDAAWQATLELVSERTSYLGIPGAAIAVVIDGKVAYTGGIGVRAASTGEPVTGDTLFRSSSAASKTAIAVALLDLAEEGRLDLHAPVSSIVPSIALDSHYSGQIDLDTLLLQRSGLDCCVYRPKCAETDADVTHYFEGRGTIPSLAPPGAIWEYTASGAVTGAAVLQAVEGKPFTEVLRDRVLGPAGMETATYDATEAATREHAVGHLPNGEVDIDQSGPAACGEYVASTGLLASAKDHGRFLELLLAPGKVLEQSSLDLIQGIDHNPGFGPHWSYGYQAYGLDYKGVRVFHHYGSSDGYTSGISWIPERRFGVALLTNGDEGAALANVYGVEELRWKIIDQFLGLTGDPPNNTTPLSSWSKYVGTFVDPAAPEKKFIFEQDGSNLLTVRVEPDDPTPRVLGQGAPDAPYEGGDVFSFLDPTSYSTYFLVGFFFDEGGSVRFANTYGSASGHHVASRVE